MSGHQQLGSFAICHAPNDGHTHTPARLLAHFSTVLKHTHKHTHIVCTESPTCSRGFVTNPAAQSSCLALAQRKKGTTTRHECHKKTRAINAATPCLRLNSTYKTPPSTLNLSSIRASKHKQAAARIKLLDTTAFISLQEITPAVTQAARHCCRRCSWLPVWQDVGAPMLQKRKSAGWDSLLTNAAAAHSRWPAQPKPQPHISPVPQQPDRRLTNYHLAVVQIKSEKYLNTHGDE